MNRLKDCVSPYLQAHKDNPINWYFWTDEAFKEAEQRNCPIFISIGYHACHWCHVMARESFNDPKIAEFLNENFVSIKVDREEHPEVDNYYMQACILMNLSGGWPLSVFCLPDGKPFFAGTYFPAYSIKSQVGFYDLLKQIIKTWYSHKEDIIKSAIDLDRAIRQPILLAQNSQPDYLNRFPTNINSLSQGPVSLEIESIIQEIKNGFYEIFDPEYGGFGKGAKFPQAPLLNLALTTWFFTKKDPKLLSFIVKTLNAFATQATYDQIFGGFFRYSVNRSFSRPHFEKMLYDQAQLAEIYLNAFKATGNAFYKQIANEVIDFVINNMRLYPAGFASALLADTQGKEGATYLFTDKDLEQLSNDEKTTFNQFFKLSRYEDGFIITKNPTNFDQTNESIKSLKMKLSEIQARRPQPEKDDKIVLELNAMMLKSIFYAGFSLNRPDLVEKALDHLTFIETNLVDKNRYFRVFRNNKAQSLAVLSDLAWLADCYITASTATLDLTYLEKALKLTELIVRDFYNKEQKLFLDSAHSRLAYSNLYDTSTPSGISKAIEVLYKIGVICARNDLIDLARKAAGSLQDLVSSDHFQFSHLTNWLIIMSKKLVDIYYLEDYSLEINDLRWLYDPRCVLIFGKSPNNLLAHKSPGLIYVCTEGNCLKPTKDIKELLDQLKIDVV